MSEQVLQLREVSFFNTVLTTQGGIFVQNPKAVLGLGAEAIIADNAGRSSKNVNKWYVMAEIAAYDLFFLTLLSSSFFLRANLATPAFSRSVLKLHWETPTRRVISKQHFCKI